VGVVPRATVVGVVVRNVVSASFRNPFMVVVKRRDNCHVARRALKSVVYHRALIDHLRDQDLGRGGATESGTYKWLVDSVSCRSPGDAEWERAHPCILTGSNTSQPQRGGDIGVPATLQATIAARIDRLELLSRRTLHFLRRPVCPSAL